MSTHGNRIADTAAEVTLGLVTALPVECAAVRMMIDELDEFQVPGDPNQYQVGWLPSKDPRHPHRAVVALQTQDGTRNAAAISTDMARSFPRLRVHLMCGIGGGIPRPDRPEQHVRLGDIVVASQGLVDYGHLYQVDGTWTLRRPLEGLSKQLLRADHELEIEEYQGNQPWRTVLRAAIIRNKRFRRPPDDADRLMVSGCPAPHPDRRLSRHEQGWPRVHHTAIGSADTLLRDAVRRDELAARYRIKAVEMEGSGIAVGADLHQRQWFMVRGVVDYCEELTKDDTWHAYASLAAAAYLRVLLAHCPPLDVAPGPVRPAQASAGASRHSMQDVVDALLSLSVMQDDYQRRALLMQLPEPIRTSIADNVVARLHVISAVRTCAQFPDGQAALLGVLRLALGPDSAEFHHVADVLTASWPGVHE